MPAEPPTKSPAPIADKPAANADDRSRPETPQIPSVGQGHGTLQGLLGPDAQALLQIAGLAVAFLLIVAAVSWLARGKPHSASSDAAPESTSAQQTPPASPTPAAPGQQQTNVAATADELSKPWDSKKFTFVRPYTDEKIPATVIRLPGGELWAFSLREPYGRCELEYVTDLEKLASQYAYRATHPMVGNPCNGTVYDPLKVGPLGGDTWARGEIVKGAGLRPPISINVTESGSSIIADRIE